MEWEGGRGREREGGWKGRKGKKERWEGGRQGGRQRSWRLSSDFGKAAPAGSTGRRLSRRHPRFCPLKLLRSCAASLLGWEGRRSGGAQDLDRPGPWPLSPVAVERNRDEKLSSSTNRPHFPRPRPPRGTVGQRGWRASPALWHQGGRWERVGASSRSLGCPTPSPGVTDCGLLPGARPPCRRGRLLLGAPALGTGPHGASPS